VGFVLPTGYSLNLDGSTLYLAAASLFVAQLAGVELDARPAAAHHADAAAHEQGRGGRAPRRARDPHRHAHTFGLPLEGAALLLGVDQLLDMGRTAVNVMGNCIATVVVARWEGVFDDAQMRRAMQGGTAAADAEGA
jgi:proton glutamate symport protein